MLIKVYEVLFNNGPRIVIGEGADRIETVVDPGPGVIESYFHKDGKAPRKMRLVSEMINDEMTIEGLYCSINNNGLQVRCLHSGVVVMRLGSTEFYIDTDIDQVPTDQ